MLRCLFFKRTYLSRTKLRHSVYLKFNLECVCFNCRCSQSLHAILKLPIMSWNTSLSSLAHFFAASKAKVVFFCIIVYLQIYWALGALVCQAMMSKANLLLLQKNTERQCCIHIQILQLPLLTLSMGAALGIMSGKGSVHYLLKASEIWWVESHLTLWWAFLKANWGLVFAGSTWDNLCKYTETACRKEFGHCLVESREYLRLIENTTILEEGKSPIFVAALFSGWNSFVLFLKTLNSEQLEDCIFFYNPSPHPSMRSNWNIK